MQEDAGDRIQAGDESLREVDACLRGMGLHEPDGQGEREPGAAEEQQHAAGLQVIGERERHRAHGLVIRVPVFAQRVADRRAGRLRCDRFVDGGAAVYPHPIDGDHLGMKEALPVRRPVDATDRGNDAVSHHEESWKRRREPAQTGDHSSHRRRERDDQEDQWPPVGADERRRDGWPVVCDFPFRHHVSGVHVPLRSALGERYHAVGPPINGAFRRR